MLVTCIRTRQQKEEGGFPPTPNWAPRLAPIPKSPEPGGTYPTNLFFDFSKFLENSKNFPDYREYSKYLNVVLILRICSVKVSKIQVEREGGVGDT
jgi:hypothetical protein